MSKSVLHLDLHAVAKNSVKMREALDDFFTETLQKRVKKAEIIPGKGETVWETVARGCQPQRGDNLNRRRRRATSS